MRAQFSNYTSWGLEGGRPVALRARSGREPFVGVAGGPTVGGDVGVLFAMGPRVALGVTSGLRDHTKLQDIEGLAGTGLETLNDVGDKWAFPVGALLRFSFQPAGIA